MTKSIEVAGLRLFEEWGIELNPNGDVIPAMNEQDAMNNAAFPRKAVVRWTSEWSEP